MGEDSIVTDTPKVAYLGPPGTFSQAALLRYFGNKATAVPCTTIEDAFVALAQDSVDFAVVPVENSTEGIVNNTQDCLVEFSVAITGEVVVPIEHHLLVSAETADTGLIRIASHRQSLAQCRKWLQTNHADVPVIECSSNAEAAKMAAEQKGVAAIAGQLAADTYQLTIRSRAIQDQEHNSTRFLILGGSATTATGRDKTTILVYAANRPGALFHVLEPFATLEISLTKIDSRPAKKTAWEYVFFIDFEGHVDDEKVQELFVRLESCTEDIKVAGSYPTFTPEQSP